MADRYWRGGTASWSSTGTTNWCASSAVVIFTGSCSSKTLTVSSVTSGTLAVGMTVWTAAGTSLGTISSFGTGTGGVGTYNMSTGGTFAAGTAFTAATAGASTPTASDNVIFDANSGNNGNAYVVTTSNSTRPCLNLTISGVSGMTLAGSQGITVNGSMSLPSSGLTWTNTAALTFAATTTGKTIDGNGLNTTITSPITFNGAGGGWTLTGDLNTTAAITLTNGTLDLGSYRLTGLSFSSSNSNTRTLNLNSGILEIIATGAATVWNTGTVTGLTISSASNSAGRVQISGSAAVARTISTGSLSAANSVNFEFTATAGSIAFTSGNVVKSLTINCPGCSVSNIAITLYGDYTYTDGTLTGGTNAWTFGGTSGTQVISGASGAHDFPVTFNGVGGTFQISGALIVGTSTSASARTVTLTNGTLDLTIGTLYCGIFSSSNSNTRAITSQVGQYLVVVGNGATVWSCATTTGLTLTDLTVQLAYTGATLSRTVTHGSTAGGSEANAVNIWVSAGTDSIAFTAGSFIGDLSFNGYMGNFNAAQTIYGSLTFGGVSVSSMTLGASAAFTLSGTLATKYITTNGKTLGASITVAAVGGTYALGDAVTLATGEVFTLTQGTLDLNGFDLTVPAFSSDNANVRSIAFGTNKIVLTGSGGTIWSAASAGGFGSTGTAIVECNYSGSTGTRTITHGTTGGAEMNAMSFRFSAGTDAISFTAGSLIKSLEFTGYAGVWPAVTTSIYGDLLFSGASVASMTFAPSTTTNTFVFSGSGSGTIYKLTTNGKAFSCCLVFAASNGTVQLQDNLTMTAAPSGSWHPLVLSSGTLDLNGKTITTTEFSSNSSNIRTLNPNGGTFVLTGSNGTVWNVDGTNYSTTSSPTATLNYSGSTGTRTITNMSAQTTSRTATNALTLTVGAASDTITLNGGFASPDFSAYTGSITTTTSRTFYGTVDFAIGPTWSATTSITYLSACTVTSHGQTLDFPISADSGVVQLLDSLTLGSTRDFRFNTGTLNLNNFNVTAGVFNCNTNASRVIQPGSTTPGKIIVTGSGATVVNIGTGSGLTGGGVVIESTYSGSVGTRTFTNATSGSLGTNNTWTIKISAGSDIVDVSGSFYNLDLTGFTGTLNNSTRSIYGSWTIPASGVTLAAGTLVTTFAGANGDTTVYTLDTNGVTLDFPITIDKVNTATLQLSSALTLGSTRTLTMTSGTLDLNNFTATCGLFSSTAPNTRVIAFGTGKIVIAGSGATVFNLSTFSGWSITGSKQFELNYAGATGTRVVSITGTSATDTNTPNVKVSAGTDTVTVASAVHDLDFTGFAGTVSNSTRVIYGSLTLSAVATYAAGTLVTSFGIITSGTQVITSNGALMDFPVTVGNASCSVQLADDVAIGSTRTFTHSAGALDLNNHTLSCGIFSVGGTRTMAFGTSGKVSVTGSGTTVLTGSMTSSSYTGNPRIELTYSGSVGTRTTNLATSSGETNSYSLYITAGSDIVSLGGNFLTLDMTGFTGTISNTASHSIYGGLIFGAGMTVSTTGTFTLAATSGTWPIGGAGATIAAPITFNGVGGTWQLQDNMVVDTSKTVTLLNGTLDLNNKTLTCGVFSSSTTTARAVATGTTGKLAVTGAGVAFNATTGTNLTFSGTGTISMTSASAKTFAGGGRTYPTLSNDGAGALTITGSNTFADITNTAAPTSIVFTSGTTTTVSGFHPAGTAGNLVSLSSSIPGSPATLSDSSGLNSVSYCSVTDLIAGGGATWKALLTNGNTNGGGDTGWIFTDTTAQAGAFFLWW